MLMKWNGKSACWLQDAFYLVYTACLLRYLADCCCRVGVHDPRAGSEKLNQADPPFQLKQTTRVSARFAPAFPHASRSIQRHPGLLTDSHHSVWPPRLARFWIAWTSSRRRPMECSNSTFRHTSAQAPTQRSARRTRQPNNHRLADRLLGTR